MTKDEALRMALDVLKTNYGYSRKTIEALTAIQEALAQPSDSVEQEPVAKYIGECSEGSLVQLCEDVKKGTALYTTPQKREWVGISDAEIQPLLTKTFADDTLMSDDMVLIRAVEAKLKELNHD